MNAEVLTIKGEKFAIIPLAIYEKLIEAIEDAQDAADAKAIEERIARGEGEYMPASVVDAILDGESPVKVYREYRKKTQAELAAEAGLSVDMIKKIESGKSDGSLKSLKAIAKALNVDLEDIV
ncbi:MAG: helix-turn-helix transcriptional regulator [Alphaproteobacteria bacterium]|nr:helix-turn-helix transcriptional regulator [Alphaproteobacteria bacterium]